MAWKRLLPALIASAVFTSAPAKAQDATGDLALLQGTWTTKDANGAAVVMAIEGTKATSRLSRPAGEIVVAKTIRLDETTRPKSIDFLPVEGGKGGSVPGIFRIEGDTLTVCTAARGRTRPKAFTGGKGGGTVTVYRREVPEPVAGAEKPKAPERDALAALQGTWHGWLSDGSDGDKKGKDALLVVKGDKATLSLGTRDDLKVIATSTLHFEEPLPTHALDFKPDDPAKPGPLKGPALFEMGQDEFKLCLTRQGFRPVRFVIINDTVYAHFKRGTFADDPPRARRDPMLPRPRRR